MAIDGWTGDTVRSFFLFWSGIQVNSMRKVQWVIAALCALLWSASAIADDGWVVDFEAAKELAAKEGKDILMEFTGSDWCPPCKALKAKVFDTDVFKTRAPGRFILLKLDNPNDKSKQTPAEIAQYRRLSEEFKITGVPTIILADAQGRPFAKTVGFGGQDAEQYLTQLEEQQTNRAKRDELLAEAEKVQGVERAKRLDQALAVVDSELAISQYRGLVDEIIKLDDADEAGLKSKYQGIIKMAEVRAALLQLRREAGVAGPEESVKKIDELIAKMNPEGEALQEALFLKGSFLFRDHKDRAKEALEQAQKVAPESRLGQQIARILEAQFRPADAAGGKDEKKDSK